MGNIVVVKIAWCTPSRFTGIIVSVNNIFGGRTVSAQPIKKYASGHRDCGRFFVGSCRAPVLKLSVFALHTVMVILKFMSAYRYAARSYLPVLRQM